MRRSILVVLAATALGIASANVAAAAGKPTKTPVYKPIPYVAYNWSGFYVGANGGGGWGRSSDSNAFFGATTGNFRVSGALGGGQIGYNWQFDRWVLGIESDMDASGIKGSNSVALCAGVVCTTKNTWLGTARARVGYATDRWLPYVTGGVAYGNVRFADSGGAVNGTTSRAGWTIGGGYEYGVATNWSAKVEVLYVDLGSAGLPCQVVGGVACGISTQTFKASIVRGALNYRF